MKAITNMAASVHARLLKRAKAEGRPFNELLQYYAMERFLYRLSRSRHADRFVLKGALMLQLWGGAVTRATKDIDLLGHGPASVAHLVAVVNDCFAVQADDGIQFEPDSVVGEEIRIDATYGGVRLRFQGRLGNARLPLQVDVGFGDIVTPHPAEITYPSLLGLEEPRLLGYTPETAVAEKLHAMVILDMANSRLKDFFDIWMLAQGREFAGPVTAQAIRSTFQRRKTRLPESTPVALTAAFHGSPRKQTQWRAYLRKTRVQGAPEQLAEVVAMLHAFLAPVLESLRAGEPLDARWTPGGPWTTPRVRP